MRHRLPSGDPAAIVEQAFEVLHAELLKRKAAQVATPRTGRMAESRCGATGVLEFHHVRPYAVGGAATVDNLQMRCRAHNGFEWERHLDEAPTVREGWADAARRVKAAGTHSALDPSRATRFDQDEWKW